MPNSLLLPPSDRSRQMEHEVPEPVDILGLRVHPLERQRFLHILEGWLSGAEPTRLYYTNAHVFNLAYRDSRFRASLNGADLLLCEGVAGRLGSAIIGTDPRIPESLNTMTWIDEYLQQVNDGRRSVFLLGDEAPVVAACAERMRERHPGLVVTAHHGFFRRDGEENDGVLDAIEQARPDVLIVGMGNPIQEFWIDDNLDRLRVIGVTTILSLGGMIRWYSGVERPWAHWMLRLHLGWLGRLVRHPIRYFRRYVIGNPLFLGRCVRQRLAAHQ